MNINICLPKCMEDAFILFKFKVKQVIDVKICLFQ